MGFALTSLYHSIQQETPWINCTSTPLIYYPPGGISQNNHQQVIYLYRKTGHHLHLHLSSPIQSFNNGPKSTIHQQHQTEIESRQDGVKNV